MSTPLRASLVLAVLAATGGVAAAAPRHGHDAVRFVHDDDAAPAPRTPVVVYLNRSGGAVSPGDDDARANTSSLVEGKTIKVPAWRGGDARWRATVACVKERMAPFQVDFTEERPASGHYIMAMVGGQPSLLGYDSEVSGIAPYTGDVMPDAIVYAFAADLEYDPDVTCVDVIHEVGHALGLDHEYLCQDPMSYLWDCEEPKQFQDVDAPCGEDAARACENGQATQNSYRVLAHNVGLRPGAVAPSAEPPQAPAQDPGAASPGDDGGGGGDDGSYGADGGSATATPGDGGDATATPGDTTDPTDATDATDGSDATDATADPGDDAAPPAAPPARAPRTHTRVHRIGLSVEGPAGIIQGNRSVTITVRGKGDITDATLAWLSPDNRFTFTCSAMPATDAASCQRRGNEFVFRLDVGTGWRYFAAIVRDRSGHSIASEPASVYLR